jgi:hypothetical protein
MLRTSVVSLIIALTGVATFIAPARAQIQQHERRVGLPFEDQDSVLAVAPVKEGSDDPKAPNSLTASPEKLARDLQTELKRVGCFNGAVDGAWGEQSRKALKNFARYAKLSITSDEPTSAALDAASAIKARTCPLVCDDDERVLNGRCVAKPRRAQREREPARETRRHAVERERPSAEPKPFKLCNTGGRAMALCD